VECANFVAQVCRLPHIGVDNAKLRGCLGPEKKICKASTFGMLLTGSAYAYSRSDTTVLQRCDTVDVFPLDTYQQLAQSAPSQRMGKKRIIAETGAGQHGVATATVLGSVWTHHLHELDAWSASR
jgi:hypothetical protein